MKRPTLLTATVAVLVVGLVCLLIQNRRLHAQLQERAATVAPPPAPAPVSAPTPTPVLPGYDDVPPARAIAPASKKRSAAARWADPQWRAAQYNRAYLATETRYARFFQRLKDWPPEKLEALKRQFANQDLALMQAMMTAEGSDPAAAIERARADGETQLKAALTEAEYRSFQETEYMESNQQALSSVLNAMRSRGQTIDPAQEEAALRVYANTLHDVATQAAATPVAGLSTDQLAELKRQQLQVLDQALFRAMSTVLNEAQLKSFMEAQIEQQGGG